MTTRTTGQRPSAYLTYMSTNAHHVKASRTADRSGRVEFQFRGVAAVEGGHIHRDAAGQGLLACRPLRGLATPRGQRGVHERAPEGFGSIEDVTPLPHNGCRPPKKRRV